MSTIVVHQDKHSLTTRERKGLQFEAYVSRKLENLAIPYQRQSSKADFLLPYDIQLEAKFTHAKVFPSWVRRDWIRRFTPEAILRIVITNRGIKLSEESLRLLKEHHIYLVYYDEAYRVRNAYEWIRFLYEVRQGIARNKQGVTSFIEANNLEYVIPVLSSPLTIDLHCNKPLTAISESVKSGHLNGETINVGVKLLDWIRSLLIMVSNCYLSHPYGLERDSAKECWKL